MLDNRNLEALAAVIDEGGFDKAATALHLTQSAVSQRIRNLEGQMGRVLVVRSTPPRPTAAGQELLRHLRQVRLLERELADAVGIGAEHGFTVLPLGVNADSLATWFLDALEPFLRAHGVLPDLRVDDENRTLELLRRGEVAGCVATSVEPPTGCRCDPLGVMDYLCVCAPGFREAWFPEGFIRERAERAPAAVFNRQDAHHARLLAEVFPGGAVRHPVFWVPSSESFADVVRRGLAYGLVPEPQARSGLASGELVDLLPGTRLPVALHWHSWDMDTPLLGALRRALTEYFRA